MTKHNTAKWLLLTGILCLALIVPLLAVGCSTGLYLPLLGSRTFGNCSSPSFAAQYAIDVLELTNTQRLNAGLGQLAWDDTLAQVAAGHACDMINDNFFEHENLEGEHVGDRATALNYQWQMIGENLAAGQTTPQQVVDGWMASEGHRKNILRPQFTTLGIAYRQGGSYMHYWVQVFAMPFN